MCGIFGYIGQPLHPKANYALLTNLALKTEHRGKEATGIWGAQGGVDGQIVYHKEPINATKFIEKAMWKSLRKFNPNVLMVHCREPTQGLGAPSINKNNHPHVNDDYTIGLIHNGRVEEYYKYKERFKEQIKSQCDSELLLRVFETGERVPSDDLLKRYPHLDPENFYRLFGIEQIFKKFEKTHMAVGVGERHEGTKRSLWLFRNEKRPMQIIDLRSSMGQIFFVSTMSIWREAVEATHEVKNIIPLNHDVIEFPVHYAYALSFDPAAPDEVHTEADAPSPELIGQPVAGGWKSGWRVRKYKLNLTREEGVEEDDTINSPDELRPLRSVQVYTGLNDSDEIQGTAAIVTTVATGFEDSIEDPPQAGSVELEQEGVGAADADTGDCTPSEVMGPGMPVYTPTYEPDAIEAEPQEPDETPAAAKKKAKKEKEDAQQGYDLDKLSTLSTQIQDVVREIGVTGHNNAMEGNIKPSDFQQLVDDMEQLLADVKGVQYSVTGGV